MIMNVLSWPKACRGHVSRYRVHWRHSHSVGLDGQFSLAHYVSRSLCHRAWPTGTSDFISPVFTTGILVPGSLLLQSQMLIEFYR